MFIVGGTGVEAFEGIELGTVTGGATPVETSIFLLEDYI